MTESDRDLDALGKVPGSYTTVQAVVTNSVDTNVLPEVAAPPLANGIGYGSVFRADRPAVSSSRSRIWLGTQGQRRVEMTMRAGEEERTITAVQGLGRWWLDIQGIVTDTGSGRATFSLAPAELFERATWLLVADLAVLDAQLVAGRECLKIRATMPGGQALSPHPQLFPGAISTALVHMDVERGVLLRVAGLVDGSEAVTAEVQYIEFDAEIPAERFRPEMPPGHFIHDVDRDRMGAVSIAEALSRVDFRIVLPTALGSPPTPSYFPRTTADRGPTLSFIYDMAGGRQVHIWLSSAQQPDPEPVPKRAIVWRGRPFDYAGSAESGWSVYMEHSGTRLKIASDLPRDELLDIAATVQPYAVDGSGSDPRPP